MNAVQLIEKIAKHEDMKKDELIKESLIAYLLDKKRAYQEEKFQILSRYNISTAAELKKLISSGKIIEHPTWEDLIEIKNIDKEIKKASDDLKSLQKN